jgi:hypothetical protein
MYTVLGGGGVGVWGFCWRPYLAGVLHSVSDQIQKLEPSKLLDHPKQKPRKGGGLRQINTRRKIHLQVNFLDDDILHCLL